MHLWVRGLAINLQHDTLQMFSQQNNIEGSKVLIMDCSLSSKQTRTYR